MANEIDVMPEKSFFIDMITRDISLERSILDLVDNCIDGAKRLRIESELELPFEGLRVSIIINNSSFSISDNCGGFSAEIAKNYAFRFGRPKNAVSTRGSIGQFGIGMKRALFKICNTFNIRSKTNSEEWNIFVDIDKWAEKQNWTFDLETIEEESPEVEIGTRISSNNIRKNVSDRFASLSFHSTLLALLKMSHRDFISKGLEIRLNNEIVTASKITVKSGNVDPVVELHTFENDGEEPVNIKIIAGFGDPLPKEAGWYVICNGRVILAADKSVDTGWGDSELGVAFHPTLARFRGIIYFESNDSGQIPWNTSKTHINSDSLVWRFAYGKMLNAARIIIDALRKLSKEIEDMGLEGSIFNAALMKSNNISADYLNSPSKFAISDSTKPILEDAVKISFSRPKRDVDYMKAKLNVTTAKALGERLFDIVHKDYE